MQQNLRLPYELTLIFGPRFGTLEVLPIKVEGLVLVRDRFWSTGVIFGCLVRALLISKLKAKSEWGTKFRLLNFPSGTNA